MRTEYKAKHKHTTHQIHAISGTRHQAGVADGVQRAQLVELQTFVHEVNGHKLHSSESTIYAANELVYS